MDIVELREYALALGVLSAEKYTDAAELIRTIQLATGHEDCFRSPAGCPAGGTRCQWEAECTGQNGVEARNHPENGLMEACSGGGRCIGDGSISS